MFTELSEQIAAAVGDTRPPEQVAAGFLEVLAAHAAEFRIVTDQIGEFAALLHDVGKIAIPKEIINKPGKLDPEEWVLVKTHTLEGQKMLDRVGGFMHDVGLIVRSHHERWDGGGYPDGLAGEAIPLEARIITCCDTWNAMRTDRPYRQALSQEAALAELHAHAGRQFDSRIVNVMIEVVLTSETSAATSSPEAQPPPHDADLGPLAGVSAPAGH